MGISLELQRTSTHYKQNRVLNKLKLKKKSHASVCVLCFVYSFVWFFLINENMTQMFPLPEVSPSDPPKGPKASFHLSDL